MAFYTNPTFWIVVFIAFFLGIAYKLPLVGQYMRQLSSVMGGHKKAVFIIGAVTVLMVFGVGWLTGLGDSFSLSGAVTTAGGTQGIGAITELTGSSGDADGCSFAVDATQEDVSYLRCTDDQSNQTSHNNMTITAQRSGSAPLVCIVTVRSADFKSPSDTADANNYNILRKDSTGKFYTYIKDGGTKSTVTDSDAQQKGTLSFLEGVGTGTVGIMMQLQESGTDELNQYDSKNVYIDIKCDGSTKTYTIEYLEMDAAA